MTAARDARPVVLVTGCSSGIGRAAALGLPRDRYRVFASTRDPAHLDAFKDTGLDTLTLDLASSDSIHRAVAALLETSGGRLYGLVNNGAYGQPGAVEDLSREALRRQFEVNVFGTHELTRSCIPAMRAAGRGRIIQISSILGRISLANRGAYNASKHALEALSDTMRLELRGTGIEICLVEPGPIESRFRSNAYAAFKRYVDHRNSVHSRMYASVIERLGSIENAPFTLPPEAVVRTIRHALDSERPRIRYPVTLPARVLPTLKRFLTDRAMDRILGRVGDRPPVDGE